MMENIQEIHEDVYNELKKRQENNPNFFFTLRSTNRFGRLQKGYWFHGNDNYLAVSFWSGQDWKNKTPNLIFVITENDCYFEVSVTDSDIKKDFAAKHLKPIMNFDKIGYKYYKFISPEYPLKDKNYLKSLNTFLDEYKPNIDKVVKENEAILKKDSNSIGFITKKTFDQWNENIEYYRDLRKRNLRDQKLSLILDTPNVIKGFKIKNYLKITDCGFDNIPSTNRCVMFTGDNGTGKSTILKAIALALTNDHKQLIRNVDPGHYDISLNYFEAGKSTKDIHFFYENANTEIKLECEGYAAYGPNRLTTSRTVKKDNVTEIELLNRTSDNYGLFNHDPILIDFMDGIKEWFETSETDELVNSRIKIITEVLQEIVPSFSDLLYDVDNTYDVLFRIENEDKSFDLLKFEELSSGVRSIISLLGDLMIRLFRNQRNEYDVSRLKGIVFIDEIDLHFHPKLQKLFVKTLTETFRGVQFFITTHSPIPLLGAPSDTVFLIVKKSKAKGVYIEEIDNLEIKRLSPNSILTSPIFGMENILHHELEESGDYSLLRTEDNYYSSVIHDRELDSLITKYKARISKIDDKA